MLSTTFSWRPLSSFSLGSFSDPPPPPPPPPFYFYTENQCYRCLVPLAWEVMAGGRGFASHGGVTLSRGGCAIGGSPWTSRAPPPLSDAVVNDYFSHLPHIALYRLWFNVRVSECFSTIFLAYKLWVLESTWSWPKTPLIAWNLSCTQVSFQNHLLRKKSKDGWYLFPRTLPKLSWKSSRVRGFNLCCNRSFFL